MRTLLLPPLTLALAAALGCGVSPAAKDQTAFRAPARDLTLQQADESGLEIASPVELRRAPPVERATAPQPRRARRPAPTVRPRVAAAVTVAPTPEPVEIQVQPVSLVAMAAFEEPDPRALAPGQTVTVIPAASGESHEADWTDDLAGDAGRGGAIGPRRGGGGCKPRGGGVLPGGVRGGGFRGLR